MNINNLLKLLELAVCTGAVNVATHMVDGVLTQIIYRWQGITHIYELDRNGKWHEIV